MNSGRVKTARSRRRPHYEDQPDEVQFVEIPDSLIHSEEDSDVGECSDGREGCTRTDVGRVTQSNFMHGCSPTLRNETIAKELDWKIRHYNYSTQNLEDLESVAPDQSCMSRITANKSLREEQCSILVQNITVLKEDIAAQHNTSNFYLNDPQGFEDVLLLRRGDDFNLTVDFNRPYNKTEDKIHFVVEIGSCPKVSKGTSTSIDIREGLKHDRWSAKCGSDGSKQRRTVQFSQEVLKPPRGSSRSSKSDRSRTPPERRQKDEWEASPSVLAKINDQVRDDSVEEQIDLSHTEVFTIRIPSHAVVGNWRLYVDIFQRYENKIKRIEFPSALCILFNPWNEEDQVYLADEDLRNASINDGFDRLPMGNHRQITTYPWLYGQFTSVSLNAALSLLDDNGARLTFRNDASLVCQTICKSIVNIPGKTSAGIMKPDWSSSMITPVTKDTHVKYKHSIVLSTDVQTSTRKKSKKKVEHTVSYGGEIYKADRNPDYNKKKFSTDGIRNPDYNKKKFSTDGIRNPEYNKKKFSTDGMRKFEPATPYLPTSWCGSQGILRQYMDTGLPVSYGHCYNFAGLTTTLLRSLGIPCRTVTNFSSAHDCDKVSTFDLHWNYTGQVIKQLNDDNIWSFHCWNEAWMKRPDLYGDFAGWQCMDCTPQQTAFGMEVAGPSPIQAIKRGDVNQAHNSALLFSEVNADLVNWFFIADGFWRSRINKNKIGKKILTRDHNKNELQEYRLMMKKQSYTKDLIDLTSSYKFANDSEGARASLYRANLSSNSAGMIPHATSDVRFRVQMNDNTRLGDDFEVCLVIQNESRLHRSLEVSLEVYSCYYTGVYKNVIKWRTFYYDLASIQRENAVLHISAEDYLYRMTDHSCFKINIFARVKETKQVYAETEDFRLRKNKIVVEIKNTMTLLEKSEVKCTFTNPTPIEITRCSWTVQFSGGHPFLRIPHGDLEPYQKCEITVPITAKFTGPQYFVVTFNCNEIRLFNGYGATLIITEEQQEINSSLAVSSDDVSPSMSIQLATEISE